MKKILILLIICAICSVQSALAWGRVGHATVACIAERHLTKRAKANLDRCLNGKSIIYYASWLDDYKPQMLVDLGYEPTGKDKRMHMLPHTMEVDANGEALHGNKFPDGQYLGNCLYYIEQSADRLKHNIKELDDSTRLACVQIIVHCIGDMHCPTHVRYVDNKTIGYYNVIYFGQEIRYHTIWDSQILQWMQPWSYSDVATMIDHFSKQEQAEMVEGDIYDWGRDSAKASRCVYDVKAGAELDRDYVKSMRPLTESQIAKAGYRLAKVLNDVFGR